jgi:hypothetical protein
MVFMGNRFFLLLLIIVSTLILSGCDGARKAGTNIGATNARPRLCKFRDVQTVTDSADPYVQNICGFVNGKNLFGAYSGEQRFVVKVFTGPQKSTLPP